MSLAWWQSVRDRKQRYPLRAILNTEIRQHQIMTDAWKRVTSHCVPRIAPHKTGNIIYVHYKKSVFKNYDPSDLIFCTNTTTSFDCCIHHRDDKLTAHSHTIIGIKLKCDCWTPLVVNFYEALRNMKDVATRVAHYVVVNLCTCNQFFS